MSKGRGSRKRIEESPDKSTAQPMELVPQQPADAGRVPQRQHTLVAQVIDVVRGAAEAIIDYADRVAEKIKQRIEGRA